MRTLIIRLLLGLAVLAGPAAPVLADEMLIVRSGRDFEESMTALQGAIAARGKSPSPLSAEAGDSVQFGADLIKPVGDYEVPNAFRGSITGASLHHAN